jgi:hypothetical protein
MSGHDELSVTYAIDLGTVAGLQLSARPSAAAGALGLWALLSSGAVGLLHVPPRQAILGGLVATGLHYTSELVHQFGHATAARWMGYPMTGVQLWGVLSTSVYPADEPILPARIHIGRALGGPAISLLLTGATTAAFVTLSPKDRTARLVGQWLILDNLGTFTLGALMPLGFTDGSTLLYWWRRR